jgi:hypothetical protein
MASQRPRGDGGCRRAWIRLEVGALPTELTGHASAGQQVSAAGSLALRSLPDPVLRPFRADSRWTGLRKTSLASALQPAKPEGHRNPGLQLAPGFDPARRGQLETREDLPLSPAGQVDRSRFAGWVGAIARNRGRTGRLPDTIGRPSARPTREGQARDWTGPPSGSPRGLTSPSCVWCSETESR